MMILLLPCSYFDDLMDLFTPDSEDVPTSPYSSGNDLSMILEDSKETADDVFSSSEAKPRLVPQFKVGYSQHPSNYCCSVYLCSDEMC